MRPNSATLDAKWKSRPWYHKPSGAPGAPPHPRDDLNLRLRRVLSWLGRAEKDYEARDFDAAFIFYWIAFNAMYGRLVNSRIDDEERRQRCKYFETVVDFTDSESVIYATIWSVLRDEIEKMLENRYVYYLYWKHHNNPSMYRDWEKEFDRAREKAMKAIRNPRGRRTKYVLCELFDRLNTLRNQLLHGGGTHKGRVNRKQVEPGARIMSSLVPHFIDVMLDHPDADWGAPRYPVIRESGPESGWTSGG